MTVDTLEEIKLRPIHYCVSPAKVICQFEKLKRQNGIKAVLSSHRFQRDRERWAIAISLFGFMKIYKRKYWVAITESGSVPDGYIVSLELCDRGYNLGVRNIEVQDWEKNSEDDLPRALLKKFKDGKTYGRDSILLCYGYQRNGQRIDPELIFKNLKGYELDIGAIWFLSSVAGDNYDHRLLRFYPTKAGVKFNLNDEISKHEKQIKKLVIKKGFGRTWEMLNDEEFPYELGWRD